MAKMIEVPAYVELEGGDFTSVGNITGAELKRAIRRAEEVEEVVYLRRLKSLLKAFKERGGADDDRVGRFFPDKPKSANDNGLMAT